MKRIILLLLITISSSLIELDAQETLQYKMDALAKNNELKEEGERLHFLSTIYLDYLFEHYPEYGVFFGRPADKGAWTDFSFEAIQQRRKDRELFVNAIQSIDRTKLERAEQLNYDLLKNVLEREEEEDKFPHELMPVNQLDGSVRRMMSVISLTTLSKEQDVEDLISRLEKIPVLIDQLIGLMDEGIKQNIIPPKAILIGVPEQLQNLIARNPSESALLKPLHDYLTTQPEEKKKSTLNSATKVIAEKVNPALEKLKEYIEEDYMPKARETVGLKDLPNGRDWYNYAIKFHTSTALTYQQIHEMGLREVKRIRTSMDSLIQATKFKGSFQEFNTFLRTDSQFFYDTPEELLNGYRVIAKKIDPELPKLFCKLPRLPYGIAPVPEYEEKFQTTAYYVLGSEELGRPGYFYANTYDLKSRPKWEMEALTIHEAVPGHHLQLALAQELENVPEFRRLLFYTSFIEGWGLYAESLGEDMGLYKDSYSKFGQLTYEMWRAIRLVVDTGIHGLGWTRQEAIDYFKANAAKTEQDIIVEVDRYIALPGQALAYKIGELKIKEMRARAKQQLGDKFDIRSFHDTVLENGAIPLDVLETRVNEWIRLKSESADAKPVGGS